MDSDLTAAFDSFRSTMRDKGLRLALVAVVERTDYRFIGIWRFQDGKASAVVHYDRENPHVLSADEVPAEATYCSYIHHSGQPFKTADARSDARLALHPAREAVLTYCGVPVMDSEGRVFGTLCHYDLVPRDPDQVDLELMVNIAGFLAQGGHVPPYPPTRNG